MCAELKINSRLAYSLTERERNFKCRLSLVSILVLTRNQLQRARCNFRKAKYMKIHPRCVSGLQYARFRSRGVNYYSIEVTNLSSFDRHSRKSRSSRDSILSKSDNNSRRCLPQEHVLCALTPRRFHAPSCVKFDNLTPAGRLESIRRK